MNIIRYILNYWGGFMIGKYKIKDFSTLILIFLIVSLYLFYTRPVSLNDVINRGSVRSVFVNVIYNDLEEDEVLKTPNQYSITLKKEDFDEFMKILNKYEYSITPRIIYYMFRPARYSYRIIDCTINYDGNILHQQVTVYSDNEVKFYNKSGEYRNYLVKESDENLFEELYSWLDNRYIISVQ
ncbi:MAG: hypothetical protein K0R54_2706 [Clostridiaceae bacterium]|nr:hypothetical protein [Clostridiaceae bacterium]